LGISSLSDSSWVVSSYSVFKRLTIKAGHSESFRELAALHE